MNIDTIINCTDEPLGKLYSWLPHDLTADTVVFFCEASLLLSTLCNVELSGGSDQKTGISDLLNPIRIAAGIFLETDALFGLPDEDLHRPAPAIFRQYLCGNAIKQAPGPLRLPRKVAPEIGSRLFLEARFQSDQSARPWTGPRGQRTAPKASAGTSSASYRYRNVHEIHDWSWSGASQADAPKTCGSLKPLDAHFIGTAPFSCLVPWLRPTPTFLIGFSTQLRT